VAITLTDGEESPGSTISRYLSLLLPVAGGVLAALASALLIACDVRLRLPDASRFWNTAGVILGLLLAFLGLNVDVYSASRRDLFSMLAINFAVLLPATLIGLTTGQGGRVGGLLGLAGAGIALGWSISRELTRRCGLERGELTSLLRTVVAEAFVISATIAHVLLPLTRIALPSR
jgi:hypothetical protein